MAREEKLDLFKDFDSEENDGIILDDLTDDEDSDEDMFTGKGEDGDSFDFDFEDGEDEEKNNKKATVSPVSDGKKRETAVADIQGKTSYKSYRLILTLLLLLILGGSLFWFRNDFKDLPDSIPEKIPIAEDPIVVLENSKEDFNLPEPDDTFIIAEENPQPPLADSFQWSVQVGVCRFEICVDKISSRLQEMGYSVTKTVSRNSAPLIHLISTSNYSTTQVTQLISALNGNSQKTIFPVRVRSGKGYRISLGYFPTVENAKQVRRYVEKVIFESRVSFSMNRVYRINNFIKVMTGSYKALPEARQVLKDLKDFSEFKDAFLVRSATQPTGT